MPKWIDLMLSHKGRGGVGLNYDPFNDI